MDRGLADEFDWWKVGNWKVDLVAGLGHRSTIVVWRTLGGNSPHGSFHQLIPFLLDTPAIRLLPTVHAFAGIVMFGRGRWRPEPVSRNDLVGTELFCDLVNTKDDRVGIRLLARHG